MPELPLSDKRTLEEIFDQPISLFETHPFVNHIFSVILVAIATIVGFSIFNFVSAPNIALLYVLPVVTSASLFGWGPSLLAVVLGVVSFDFFFTEPYYSLTMTNPSEIWTAALLLIVAVIVTSVAAEARRRALEASESTQRAEALHALAHTVINFKTHQEVFQAAATTLHQLFRAPVIVLVLREGSDDISITAGGARVTEKDWEAARAALAVNMRTRGESFPYDQTYFDFWPISTPTEDDCVLGVDFRHSPVGRLAMAEQLFEAVAAYVKSALVRRQPTI